jgi:hypothetical protein
MSVTKNSSVPMIKQAFEVYIKASEACQSAVKELNALGYSEVVLHDPVTKEEVKMLNAQKTFDKVHHEALCRYENIAYDPTTNKINAAVQSVYLLGTNVFSEAALWGSQATRTFDHNTDKASGQYPKKMPDTKRTFALTEMSDFSDSKHTPNDPVDKTGIKVMNALSAMVGAKERMAAMCAVSAYVDRYVDLKKKGMMLPPKKGETENIMRGRQRTKMPDILKDLKIKIDQTGEPANRSELIRKLMALNGTEQLFILPYAKYTPKTYDANGEEVPPEDVPPSWKVQASRSAVKTVCKDDERLNKAWKAEHAKALGESSRVIDPKNTPLHEVDQFTDEFIRYCKKNKIAPDTPNSIQYLTRDGDEVEIDIPGSGKRKLGFKEYAALSGSIWKGAAFEMTCRPNIADGCYYNPSTVRMIIPRGYLYNLKNRDSPPSLTLPFDDVYSFMSSFVEGRKVGEVDHVKEAMVDADCDYSANPDTVLQLTAPPPKEDDDEGDTQSMEDSEEEEEVSPSKRRKIDDSE